MRKKQLQLLEKAKKNSLTSSQINVLSREDLTLDELDIVYEYFLTQREAGLDGDVLAKEACRCLEYMATHDIAVNKPSNKKDILRCILPIYKEKIENRNRLYFQNIKSIHNEKDDRFKYKDRLVGSDEKFNIVEMYEEIYALTLTSDGHGSRWWKQYDGSPDLEMFDLYLYMLYNNITASQTNLLFDQMLDGQNNRKYFKSVLMDYPCILDDYRHNHIKSLLYYLIAEREDHDISIFNPSADVLEGLYDYESHRFTFELDQFDRYFYDEPFGGITENSQFIASLKLHEHPLLSRISKFCIDNNMDAANNYNDHKVFNNWRTQGLFDAEKEKSFESAAKALLSDFTVQTPAFSLCVSISTKYFVNIHYLEFSSVNVYHEMYTKQCYQDEFYVGERWNLGHQCSQYKIMIAPDGKIYERLGDSKRYIPLNFHHFLILCQKTTLCGNLMKTILEYYKTINPFFKDVLNDGIANRYGVRDGYIIPLTFNEVYECHNKSQLINMKYKTAKEMGVNWNKRNINLSYLMIKSYKVVEPGVSREILLQQKDSALLPQGLERNRYEKDPLVCEFLSNIIHTNLTKQTAAKQAKRVEEIKKLYKNELSSEVMTNVLPDEIDGWLDDRVNAEIGTNNIKRMAYDYVRMSRLAKKKVKLDIKSSNQIINMHDELTDDRDYYRTHTANVNVPKKSVFLPLRKLLPEKFEWIKSRKRLILETELQHHCVWSYADSISADRCAIYSFVDDTGVYAEDKKPRRYTIEFCRNNDGKYRIRQVQGKFNDANTTTMREYIQSLLDKQIENQVA